MAVAGGFAASSFLQSSATDLRMQVGGLNGKALQKGDQLFRQEPLTPHQLQLKELCAQASITFPVPDSPAQQETLRILEGPEWKELDAASRESFCNQLFTIGRQSSRMGCRISGTAPLKFTGEEMVSAPVTEGTVQLTPSGECMILLADGQTIGGYPRIAQVIKADLPVLAQKKPGDPIRFEFISLQEAVQLYEEQQESLQQLASTLACMYESRS
jgi:antagonist of KipI